MKQEFRTNINKEYHFGDWQFSPADGYLISDNKSQRLQPRLAKLLSIFVENCGVLLTRDDLIKAVWMEKSVNEDALSRCVAELRSTLGDNRSAPKYIETVPKKGYRFIHQLSNNQLGNLLDRQLDSRLDDQMSNQLSDQQGAQLNGQAEAKLNFQKPGILLSLGVLFFALLSYFFFDSSDDDMTVFDKKTQQLRNALISAKRVTTDTNLEQQPELSNKGDKIAFSVIEADRMIVKIISDTGILLHELIDINNNLLSPTFSPDDSKLLITASGDGVCTIYQYALPTLTREEITSCNIPNIVPTLDWSPSGDSFVYVAKSEATGSESHPSQYAIWTYHFESKRHQQLTFPSEIEVYDTRPQYSPNGKKLAFTRGTSSQRSIFLLDLKTDQTPSKLNKNKGFISSFNWLKDNTHIIFDSNELGDKYLWLLNSDDKQQSLLGAKDSRYPSVNKSNSRIAFQEASYNANIWQVNIENSEQSDITKQAPNRIIESIKYNNFPTYSPDGKTIAFTSNREGKASIWTYSTDTKQQQKLLAIPHVDLIVPSWSLDGKKIIVSSRGPDGYRCYEVNLKSGLFQPLYSLQQQHHECQYTEQGDIFAKLKEPSLASKLIRISTREKVKVITDFPVERIHPTHFGTLVYSLPNEDGLYSMDFDGKNRQVIKSDYDNQLDGHWTIQGDYLYYPSVKQDSGIWKLNLITGDEVKVSNIIPTAIGFTLNVSPDHKQLVYAQTDNRLADIYLTDTLVE